MRVLTWNLWGRDGDWRRRRDSIAAMIAEAAAGSAGYSEIRRW
jgi:hypothetical protein